MPALTDKTPKDQLKIQIDSGIHTQLRKLCDRHRRTPAGQIEFMTIEAFQKDFAGPGLRPGKEVSQAVKQNRRKSKET